MTHNLHSIFFNWLKPTKHDLGVINANHFVFFKSPYSYLYCSLSDVHSSYPSGQPSFLRQLINDRRFILNLFPFPDRIAADSWPRQNWRRIIKSAWRPRTTRTSWNVYFDPYKTNAIKSLLPLWSSIVCQSVRDDFICAKNTFI